MGDIVLKGDDLKFWKEKSDLIEILGDEVNELTLSHNLFPNFDDDDWDFFKKFLRKKDISYTKSKKYGTFIYNIKGYTQKRAESVLDFIMYGKTGNIDRVLNARKIRSRLMLMNNNNGNNRNNRNNNNSNNNYSTSYKKRKYNTGIRINNNNSKRKPYAKTFGKTMKVRR